MKRLSWIAASIALLMVASTQANAVVDENSAAHCSGGGVGIIDSNGLIAPPGLSVPGTPSFAAPVLNNGSVEIVNITGPGTFDVVIGDVPSAKYEAGILVVSFIGGVPQEGPGIAGQWVHPSSDNCHNIP